MNYSFRGGVPLLRPAATGTTSHTRSWASSTSQQAQRDARDRRLERAQDGVDQRQGRGRLRARGPRAELERPGWRDLHQRAGRSQPQGRHGPADAVRRLRDPERQSAGPAEVLRPQRLGAAEHARWPGPTASRRARTRPPSRSSALRFESRDALLFPDATVQLRPELPGLHGGSLGVAADADQIYATHSYRTTALPETVQGDGSLVVLDRESLAVKASIRVGFDPRAVAVNPVTQARLRAQPRQRDRLEPVGDQHRDSVGDQGRSRSARSASTSRSTRSSTASTCPTRPPRTCSSSTAPRTR